MSTTALHISLNVADLDASLEFYERALGVAPDKRREAWARVTVAEPPLVLSLNRVAGPAGGGRLSHLGVRVESAEELSAIRARLEGAGLVPRVEEQTTCCFAVQDKLWLTDPDGNDWEFYRVIADSDRARDEPKASCCPGTSPSNS